MREDLYRYYEDELRFIRRMSHEFAATYPVQARGLRLSENDCGDPHVERLIESCALLGARIRLKLDDDFPLITESLLQVLYPHYLAPIPSMAIVQLVIDAERGNLTSAYPVEAKRALYTKENRHANRFRTVYPTTLWPIVLDRVRVQRDVPDGSGQTWPGAISLDLRTTGGVRISELDIDALRFFIFADPTFRAVLYETFLGHTMRVEVRDPEAGPGRAPLVLPGVPVREVGFSPDEGMLPYGNRSFHGYRLLQEYFQFSAKFYFFDVAELKTLKATRFGDQLSITFFLDVPPPEQPIRPDHLRLGCTPAINLFEGTAKAIKIDYAHAEYPVIPDAPLQSGTEIYSVNQVSGVVPSDGKAVQYEPFYSLKHGSDAAQQRRFWHATRRPSAAQTGSDQRWDLFLSLVDTNFRPTTPANSYLTVKVTCLNRAPSATQFELEGGGPVKHAQVLVPATPTLRPPLRDGLQWRLISQLSLNYLSVIGRGEDGSPDALRELLKVYDFSSGQASDAIQQQIGGLLRIESKATTKRIRTDEGSGFARGVRTELEFDESRFKGASAFLFSSVLEKFLGLYVSINSFSELRAVSAGRVIRHWPARAGEQVLL